MSGSIEISGSDEDAVALREVASSDIGYFFDHQRDLIAIRMAAFTPEDPEDRIAFDRHWRSILENDSIQKRTILKSGQVVGNISCFEMFGERSIGYWIDRGFWGQGVATRALGIFLAELAQRPLFARVTFDNVGSIRVLERHCFVRVGEDTDFAAGRGEHVLEFVYRLN